MSLLSSKKKEKTPKKGKKSADTLSQTTGKPGRAPRVSAPKVKLPPDTYTLILLIAWIFLTAACIFLYLDIASYK